MTNAEKLRLIEDALELEEGVLTEDTVLEGLREFDSMGKLSLVILFDDEFGKKLTGDAVRSFVTVRDVLEQMN